jgi:Rrf2 family protein
MRALKASGLVKSVRGAHGGYELAREPKAITLREVFDALEGSAALAECVEDPDSCPRHKTCPTRDIWVEMTESVAGILEKTTLQDVVDRMKEKTLPRDSYEI